MKASVIRPGALVGLKTAIRGNVRYEKVDLEAAHATTEGTQRARWETTREIRDPAEYERAVQTRSRIRTLVTRQCCHTSFGLLCPDSNEGALQEAIAEADALAAEFNRTAVCSAIEFRVLVGRVANSDEQAARAIGSEVRDLLRATEAAVQQADPGAIREAANRARVLSAMLAPEASAAVGAAVEEARAAARAIVRRVEKAGEVAASVVEELSLTKLRAARFAVLDLMESEAESSDAAAPGVGAVPGIDFEPAAPTVADSAADAEGDDVGGDASAAPETPSAPALPAAPDIEFDYGGDASANAE